MMRMWWGALAVAWSALGTSAAMVGGGLQLANNAIHAAVSPEGQLFSYIEIEPSALGAGPNDTGLTGHLSLCKDGGAAVLDTDMVTKVLEENAWPAFYAAFRDDTHLQDLSFDVKAFAPPGRMYAREAEVDGFLPALVLKVSVHNLGSSDTTVTVGYHLAAGWGGPFSEEPLGMTNGKAFLSSLGGSVTYASCGDRDACSKATVKVSGKSTEVVWVIVAAWIDGGFHELFLGTFDMLMSYVRDGVASLEAEQDMFLHALPRLGNTTLDAYLRGYISSAPLLTKGTSSGIVVNMGYRELNQRDSFWTSWMQLHFFPWVDETMLRESIEHQEANGKIPTCILPHIDRPTDKDITMYFILRNFRHFGWWNNTGLLKEAWPAIRRGADFLISMIEEPETGVPIQYRNESMADWKDVAQTQGRKYAPHWGLLWLATLGGIIDHAGVVKDEAAAAKYQPILDKSFLNGDMWKTDHYVDIWYPGKAPNVTYVLEDQSVGPFFGVVAPPRVADVLSAIGHSEGKAGIRETYPYIPGWCQNPGQCGGYYHDGGIWPWLASVDICNRMKFGKEEDAIRLLTKLGEYGLSYPADPSKSGLDGLSFLPHEYLQGDTGDPNGAFPQVSSSPSIPWRGALMQGWDAAAFIIPWRCAANLRRLAPNKYAVRLPRTLSLTVPLSPVDGGGHIRMEQRSDDPSEGVRMLVEGRSEAVRILVDGHQEVDELWKPGETRVLYA